MKDTFVVLLLCGMCMAQMSVREENSTLPLPDSGSVTLTLDEYNRLVELAAKPPKKSDLAPLPYSIKHADVKLHIENDGVRGTVQLEGEVFRKGVSMVPLTSGMTVLDAHQNGKGVALIQENGTHMALLPGPGEFSLALDTGLPLRIEAGRASFSLPAPAGEWLCWPTSPSCRASLPSFKSRCPRATRSPESPGQHWIPLRPTLKS